MPGGSAAGLGAVGDSLRKVGSGVGWLWNSPTIATWASVAMRGLSLVVVLPLLLTRLSTEEIASWYLLMTIVGVQGLADVGFAPTFTRVISYAMGGAREIRDLRNAQAVAGSGVSDWGLVERIWGTMRSVYGRLTVVSVVVLGIVGSLALVRPLSVLADVRSGWIAWAVVLGASAVTLMGNAYAAYLQGVNQVALVRRWETLSVLGGIVTSFVVLLAGGRLLALVVANQSWAILNVFRNWQLCRYVEGERFARFGRAKPDAEVMRAVWPSAWRSGIGIAASRGATYASGLVYAQLAAAPQVAAYLLGLRFIQMVADLAVAPLGSKLPLLARLRSEGRIAEQLRIAQRAMRLTYWTFVAGFWTIGLSAHWALRELGSNAQFVSAELWMLLGVAFFAERYGAAHIQLYSTTNHIIWHVANGVAGVIYVMVGAGLLPVVGIYAFPLAFIAGNVGFYAWYAASHDYRAYQLRPWTFERTTVVPPLAALLSFAVVIWVARGLGWTTILS